MASIKDGNALGAKRFDLNPEVLKGVPTLEGLDELQVLPVKPILAWARRREEFTVHIAAGATLSALLFAAGLFFVPLFSKADGTPKPPACYNTPVPDSAEKERAAEERQG